MKKLIGFIVAAAAFFAVSTAEAMISPVAISIFPPLQFPPSNFDVTGVRVSALWGKHRNVYGFDFGVLGNITDEQFDGVEVSGIFNVTHGVSTAVGVQAASILNMNTQKLHVIGLQVAAVNDNEAEATVVGVDFGLINLTAHTNVYGLQAGIYNKALNIYGFQVGLVNFADDLHGLQIGVINFNAKGIFAVCPIINVGW